jgi:perosamine synthetase
MRAPLAIPRGTTALGPARVAAALRHLAAPHDPSTVRAFEQAFAAALGARHAIAVSSGKAALALILRALDLPAGAGVVVAAFNVPEVPSLITGLGLRVRFVDIDPRNYAPTAEQVDREIDAETRVLLATHLFGNPADLDGLAEVARARGLVLIEDCAQALCATWRGRPVGTFGRAALYSFGLMKSLNAFRGGMVTTDDDELASTVRRLADEAPLLSRLEVGLGVAESLGIWLATRRPLFSALVLPALRLLEALAPSLVDDAVKMRPSELESGALDPSLVTARMSSAQAAAGRAGLGDLWTEAALRSGNAARLLTSLADVGGLRLPAHLAPAAPAWTNLVVRVAERQRVRRALLREGLDTTYGYLVPCHRLIPEAAPPGGCPETDAVTHETLYLPLGDGLGPADMDRIADSLSRALTRTP